MKKVFLFFSAFFFFFSSALAEFSFGDSFSSLLENWEKSRLEFQKSEFYLPIFMFHRIDEGSGNNSFSPEKLEKFAQFFQENNIKTLTFFDLKFLEWGFGEIPEKAVILTFDDGYKNHLKAAKILKKYNLHGVFFIITDKVGKDDYLSWNNIREISSMGHEIGSHSVSHPNLENISEDQIREEVRNSKKKIEEETGQKVISFCYPSGNFDARSEKILKEEGYDFARTINPGKYFSLNKKFELNAVRIFPTTGIPSLQYWFPSEHNFYSKK